MQCVFDAFLSALVSASTACFVAPFVTGFGFGFGAAAFPFPFAAPLGIGAGAGTISGANASGGNTGFVFFMMSSLQVFHPRLFARTDMTRPSGPMNGSTEVPPAL